MVAVLALSMGTVMLDRGEQFFLGPYLVQDLGLTPGQIGVLAGTVAICWAISSFVFGRQSDRSGRKRLLVPAMITFSLLSWLSGVAQNFEQLLVIRGLLGLAEGPCWSVTLALVEESSSSQTRGRNLGVVVGSAALLGGALGPVFATQVAEHFGWRTAFFAAGVPGLALALIVSLTIAEPPRPVETARSWRQAMATLMSSKGLWLCFAAAILFAVSTAAFVSFAPLFVTRDLHFSAESAGFMLGASGFGGFIYSILWPMMSDRVGRRPALMIAAGVSTLTPLFFLYSGLSAPALAVAAFLTTTGPAIASLALVVVPVEMVPKSMAATAIGFISIGAEAVGSTLGPIAGGAAAEAYGLRAPLLLAAAAGALIVIIAVILRETHPRLIVQSEASGANP